MKLASVSDRYRPEEIESYRRAGLWTDQTMPGLVDELAASNPDRVFLTDDTGELTAGELQRQAAALAHGLIRLGLGRDDRVVVQLPNWNEFVVVAVAVARVGAILVPYMPIYRRDDVEYVVRDTGATLAISCGAYKGFDHAAMFGELIDAVPTLEHLITVRSPDCSSGTRYEDLVSTGRAEPIAVPQRGPDDPFVIIYSSGTTARPKGCLHTFNTIASSTRGIATGLDYRSSDVALGPAPITHTQGFVNAMLLPLLTGASARILESWSAEIGVAALVSSRCTVVMSPPAILQDVIDHCRANDLELSHIRVWIASGTVVPGALVEAARAVIPGAKVLVTYGRTENLSTTMCTVTDPAEKSLVSDGRTLPHQQVRIVDSAGRELPRGAVGDIAFKGASHMLEYLNNAEATAALFTPDGFSLSGDLGVMDQDGYVRVTGRTKDIIIRGGLNISARQIEDLVGELPQVRRVAVVGMPDQRLGERVCCFVEQRPGTPPLDVPQLREYLLGHGLALQKVPERVELLDTIPVSATGKIQKHQLREQIAEKLARG